MSALRSVWLLTVTGMGLIAGLAHAEDFEAGKSAAKIFESDCVTCHRSPRGLARGMGAHALVDFLREHYTTGLGPANELANYLQSGTADADNRRAPKSTGEQPHAGDPHEHAQTTAPSDADADQPGPARKHRHAASTSEPGAASEHDETAPPPHKRHHARTAEPTNDTELPANAQPVPTADGQAGSDDTPPRKHQRSPRGGEPVPSAKQRPDMTPTGATGPVGVTIEPSTAASAAAHGGEPDRGPNAPAHATREGPAEAPEPGSSAGPASPLTIRTSETGGAQASEPPSATGSSDQPTFSAPSP
ncbi:MAG TPA: hypothetical protein VEK55_16955 [Xanthobacteraceae bacterium]|nr:hypothetical protein [Xanthobacteraceae bacterium]